MAGQWSITVYAHDSETNVKQPPKVYPLVPGKVTSIGRVECDIIVEDGSVSRKHAEMQVNEEEQGGFLTLKDCSRYGTSINKLKVKPDAETAVQDGDIITLGDGASRVEVSFSNVNKRGGAAPVRGAPKVPDRVAPSKIAAAPIQVGVAKGGKENIPAKAAGARPAEDGAAAAKKELEELQAKHTDLNSRYVKMERDLHTANDTMSRQFAQLARMEKLLRDRPDDSAVAAFNRMLMSMLTQAAKWTTDKNPAGTFGLIEALVSQARDADKAGNVELLRKLLETILALKAEGVARFDSHFVAADGVELMLNIFLTTSDAVVLEGLSDLLRAVAESIKTLQRVRSWEARPVCEEKLATVASGKVRENLQYLFSKVDEGPRDEIAEYLEKELKSIIGLQQVKEQLRRLLKSIRLNEKRKQHGVAVDAKRDHHMVLLGNPGTGKTTVARLLAKLLHKIGILKSELCVEVSREDLVAGYIGQTAIQTKAVIDRARGGMLFIDEAYRLSSAGKKDFGKEAIETLMTEMTKECSDDERVIFLFAGYSKEMEEFKTMNPGMARRIAYTFNFEDYSVDELVQILLIKIAAKNFRLAVGVKDNIGGIIERNFTAEERGKYNGGLSARLVDAAIEELNMRLDVDNGSIDTLVTLTQADFVNGTAKLKTQLWS